MIVFLTVDQAIKVHDLLIEQHGGLPGIRDLGLLASAIEIPKSSFQGHYMHPTLFNKAAAYLFHIVRNHPFCDGNKRTGAFLAILFLKMNNVHLKMDHDQYETLVIGTAEGLISKAQISRFFERQAKSNSPRRISSKRSIRRKK